MRISERPYQHHCKSCERDQRRQGLHTVQEKSRCRRNHDFFSLPRRLSNGKPKIGFVSSPSLLSVCVYPASLAATLFLYTSSRHRWRPGELTALAPWTTAPVSQMAATGAIISAVVAILTPASKREQPISHHRRGMASPCPATLTNEGKERKNAAGLLHARSVESFARRQLTSASLHVGASIANIYI